MNASLNGVSLNHEEKNWSKFAVTVAVYFAGTLNDNFWRQSIMLLAVAGGVAHLQGYVTILFTIPFIIFAAYAGFLADRFSKRSVIIGSKLLSLAGYIFGAAGLYFMSWPIFLITVFILGLQATIFSPAIYGTIPEIYSADYVVNANGIINAANNVSVLLGIAVAGFVLDIKGAANDTSLGVYLAAGASLGVAFITFIVSFFVPKFPAASPNAHFPWKGPWESIVTLIKTSDDPLLANSIFAKAFFWFAGSLQILIIIPLGLSQFGLTKTMSSGLVFIELVGIGTGSLLAPFFAKGPKWYRVLVPAALVMAGSMFAVAMVPYLPAVTQKIIIVCALMVLGIAGGIFSIPVTSFVQIRPSPQFKGRMIASSNFADFVGILLSGAVFYVLDRLAVRPSNCFAIEALMVMAVAGWLLISMPKGNRDD